jgi:6-phosphofructokinase 2
MHKTATVTMNPAVDKSAFVPEVVAGRKLRCAKPRRELGGGGINVSRAIRELGGVSTAVLPAGGPTGETLTGLLDDEDIDHESVTTDAWTRENLTVFDESTNQQYRFGMPGATLKESEWQACLARIGVAEAPEYVVASGSLPPGVPEDFFAQASRAAKRIGARFLLDTSGAPLRHAVSEGVFLLKPNAREFTALTGEPLHTEEQQEQLARGLVDQGGCEVLLLSLGAGGALMVTHDHVERIRSPSVPVKSKVGAGDSMVGAIVFGLARGFDIRSAMCLGVAAGAAAVMTPGTQLCRNEDVKRLHKRLMEC